jgi:hypothetical protein
MEVSVKPKPPVKRKPEALRNSIMSSSYTNILSQNVLDGYSPPSTPAHYKEKIFAGDDETPYSETETLSEEFRDLQLEPDNGQLKFETANRLVIAIDFGTTFTGM